MGDTRPRAKADLVTPIIPSRWLYGRLAVMFLALLLIAFTVPIAISAGEAVGVKIYSFIKPPS